MSEEREEIPWDKMSGVYVHVPESSRDIQGGLIGVVLIAFCLFVSVAVFRMFSSGWQDWVTNVMAFIPLAIAAAGANETYQAFKLKPREKNAQGR